ncbi:MAG: hypothetical protein ACOCUI_00400 [bacterium]
MPRNKREVEKEYDYQKKLAKKYNKDQRVIKSICEYPFKFAKERMSDPTDDRPIRIRYFGVFTQKHLKNKKVIMKYRYDVLLDNIEDVTIMMATTLGFIVPTFDSAKKIIIDAYKNKDYEKLDMIWNGWKVYR